MIPGGTGSAVQWRKADEVRSPPMAVIFAGIAALFVAGIAAAFIYAKDTTFTQTANAPRRRLPAAHRPRQMPAPPNAGRRPRPAAGNHRLHTINRTPPKQDPREDEQKERP